MHCPLSDGTFREPCSAGSGRSVACRAQVATRSEDRCCRSPLSLTTDPHRLWIYVLNAAGSDTLRLFVREFLQPDIGWRTSE